MTTHTHTHTQNIIKYNHVYEKMGNANVRYEKVNDKTTTPTHNREIIKRLSDQDAISRTLAIEDGKLTEFEASCLFNRYESHIYRISRHLDEEPFKQHDDMFYVRTSHATSQLRIAACYDSKKYQYVIDRRKLLLFQFEQNGNVYIICQVQPTKIDIVHYDKSEKALVEWLFTPLLHETHHLAITTIKEAVMRDNIYFVTQVTIELGAIDGITQD